MAHGMDFTSNSMRFNDVTSAFLCRYCSSRRDKEQDQVGCRELCVSFETKRHSNLVVSRVTRLHFEGTNLGVAHVLERLSQSRVK